MTSAIAFQLAVAGVSAGSLYALIAIAIVLPFKASGVLHFGQGEVVMLGAYVALALTMMGLPYPVVLLGVVVAGAAVGLLIERVFIRPIVRAPEFTIVIATFAVGLLIKSLISLRFGEAPASIEGPLGTEPIIVSALRINPNALWVLVATSLVTVAIIGFFRHSRLGQAMRAVSINVEAARLMGIKVVTAYRLWWALSAAIAALAGLLVAPLVGIHPELGSLLLRGLLAAVIGGLTSIGGAVVGGLAVGLIESYSGVLVGTVFKNVVPFILLMVLLVWRPHGLFGAAEAKRV